MTVTVEVASLEAFRAKQERAYIINRRFEDLKTVVLAQTVIAPIATVMGMLMQDWWMIGGALAVSAAAGIASCYLLRRLEKTVS